MLMTRKKIIPLILLTALVLAVVVAVGFGTESGLADAEAAVNWSARVTKQTTVNGQTEYVDIASGSNVTDTTNFTFVISGYAESDNFEYYVSRDKHENKKEILDALNVEWTRISDKRQIDANTVGLTSVFTSANKDEVYIYFRRSYTENSKVVTEYYSTFWHLVINCSLTESDLGIEEIKATFLRNGVSVDYNGGWIGVGLRFYVTTKYMKDKGAAFDAGNELLSYSVDGKEVSDNTKRWLPMNYNYVTVTDTLKNGRVDFKVTDVGGRYAKYASYEGVNIDTNSPLFSLSATTYDSATGTVRNYQNREWASGDVTFKLTDVSSCISGVSYYYSYDGVNFILIPSDVHVIRTTTKGIRFRAQSSAGVVYDYNDGADFTVNIDAVQPGATATAFTDDPDKSGTLKEIPSTFDAQASAYKAEADANGQVYLNIYNKDRDGNYVNNVSGAKFFYAVSIDGGEYGEYKQATVAVNDGDNVYYRITDVLSKGVSSDRKYKFYVESGAGLRSNVTVYSVKILNSFFEIAVGDITYTPNASGWSAAPIPVYVTVPTDSKIQRNNAGEIIGYTEPTTKYTFFYSPLNIAGLTYEAKGEYYNYVENEEGKSVYRFYLAASAESAFSIYAKNGAGKRSDNTYVGVDVIKIDVLEPEVETSAYIFPESDVGNDYVYIKSAEWVNGRIIFTFNVKDGVSGVYVKDLNFAVDGEGKPVYNGNGELIWQESANSRTASGTVNKEDGSRYYVYNVEIGLPDSTVVKMSKEYRFRVYTGSGVYKDISFVANIDTTRIQLDSIDFITEEKTENIAVVSNKITLPSVREGATIKLIPNAEQTGHFGYYVYNEVSGKYEAVDGEELEFTVPSDRKGELIKKFYLVSKAKDYKGVSYSTDSATPYEIVIPYNTLNISINYELITDTVSGSAEWVDSNLTVQISLTSDDTGTIRELTDAEKADYTYYYMLINNDPGLNLTEAIRNGTWLKCENGGYIAGSTLYSFEIDFSHKSFYGYIALSVTNEAGFRSFTPGDVNRLLFIDRTTPDVSAMISVTSGINERTTIEGVSTRTYYSKDEITLVPRTYTDRSLITYYYFLVGEDGTLPTENPTSDNANGWTKLTRNLSLYVTDGETASYEYLFYAVNELGRTAGGVSGERYLFEIDTSKISGTLSYNQNDGGYYDPTLGMQAYIWKEAASISLKVIGSNTFVKYYYSIDDGKTWNPYLEPSGNEAFYAPGENNAKTLTFNASYFPDGINNAFSFKAVNKAGSEYIFKEKIYIAIDTMTPEFSVSLSVDGVSYDGGGTELSSYTATNWSNRPVTIKINPVKVNVSGVKYTYVIEYLVNRTPTKTTERETPSNDTFTTDRLDGFGINRDAVVTIRATSRADSSKYSEVSFRVKVDQTVPVFTLTGQASNDDYTETKTIASGDWTNYPRVSVSKASDPDHVNVSNVYYTYTYKDLESTGITSHDWPDGNPVFDKICTITVTARSDAGLTYVKEFAVNIDTVVPKIGFMKSEAISVISGGKQYIDLKVYVEEENIEICEYITTKGETRGFAFDPSGYVISTSSVDNTVKYDKDGKEYRGYVYIYVKDYAGNVATFEFYMLPFELDVNNVTLKNEDAMTIDRYENDLNAAESYMEPARVTYFRNLIQRLRDRVNTLENEIATYRTYLEKLAQRTSFELKSDYAEMFEYLNTYNNYKLYGQEWIQEAITEDAGSVYYAYFQNLTTQFERLRKQMAAVESIEDQVTKLPAINMVEASDYDDVLTVYKAYGDLTSDQKACFTTHLYTKLLALKKRCEILLLTDEDSGISLDGGFAEQAKIRVESFAEGSEYYTNAQTAVLNAVKDENAARAVVAIYRISIVGAASQTSTGKVKIEMPIPESYRQYVRFAVYEMSSDGALTQVKDMKINGDGKAVTFTSDELTTYVLTTKANIQVNDSKTDTYGKFLGLDLDVEMIRTLAIIGGVLFAVVIVVVIIAGIRHKRFLNTYNRAYKSGIYRRGIQRIPKGNTRPRTNPQYPTERVKTQKKPY